jgi:hypothetical protein
MMSDVETHEFSNRLSWHIAPGFNSISAGSLNLLVWQNERIGSTCVI